MTSSSIPQALTPGPLFSIINRTRVIYLNERLRPFQLSAGQIPVFMCLLHHPNIIQESMARYFHLDKGTIARTVRKMEDAGYVKKCVDPENRRAFRLSLTDKGHQIAPHIVAISHEWELSVCAVLKREEQEVLQNLLRTVAENSIATIKALEG